jgi:hypothetical protein
MNVRWLPLCAAAASLALAPAHLNAQTTVATDPVGFTTINITPGSGIARKTTLMSIPLLDVDSSVAGLSTGTISSVTSNSIVVSNAGWAAGALSQPAAPFVVQITSGPASGRFFLVASLATTGGASGGASFANTSSNLFISSLSLATVSNNLVNAGISAGHSFKLYACDTLSWFGSPATTGIRGGSNAASADNIIVTINGSATTYFFNTNTTNWQASSGPSSSRSNVALLPSYGVSYNRLASNALSFVSTGQVPTTNNSVAVKNSGVTVLSSYWPTTNTLRGLGIQNLPGWVTGTSQAAADNVIVVSGGSAATYFYNGTNWRRTGPTISRDDVLIPIGSSVQINKKGAAGGFSTLTQAVPYTLN